MPAKAEWLADSTFWWGMCSVDLLDCVLEVAGGRLYVTPAIRDELARHVEERPFLGAAIKAIGDRLVPTLTLEVVELAAAAKVRSLWQVSPRDAKNIGEAEIIAVARNRGLHSIIDDRQARFHIEYYYSELVCIDTPHVLLHLVEIGRIADMNEAWALLCRMRDEGGFTNHAFADRPKAEWIARKRYPKVVPL